MPRPLRYPLVDVPQHVIQRGHNRQPVFFHPDDDQMYLQCLQDTAAISHGIIHTYMLMTNQVHVLMTPHQVNSLVKVKQSLCRRYVQYINTIYQRTGTLGDGRYRASLVEADAYLRRATAILSSTRFERAWYQNQRRIPGRATAGMREASLIQWSQIMRALWRWRARLRRGNRRTRRHSRNVSIRACCRRSAPHASRAAL